MEPDQQLLDTIIRSMVDDVKAVQISRTTDQMGVLLTVRVGRDDMGKVIGKNGSTITALRAVMRACGRKQNARLNVKVLEPAGVPQSTGGDY